MEITKKNKSVLKESTQNLDAGVRQKNINIQLFSQLLKQAYN